jgi:hypothetical protein
MRHTQAQREADLRLFSARKGVISAPALHETVSGTTIITPGEGAEHEGAGIDATEGFVERL